MEIVLASRNKNKIRELEDLLGEYIKGIRILSLDDVGFEGDIDENGKSFAENAMIKAESVAKLGYIGLGDDSGLSVRALGGAPGIYSARYAGVHGDDTANNEKLLRELSSKDDRYAEFVCAIACVFPNGESICVEGKCPGTILEELCGEGGFGYDPLFLYEPMEKTFASMSAEEKNSISHRGRAIAMFAEKLLNYNK